MRILLIDDIRKPILITSTYGIEGDFTIATSYQEGIDALTQNETFDLLCLDHDLSSYDETGKEKTGYDIMLFLECYQQYMPKAFLWVSSNPVGRRNMQAALDSIRGEND